MDRSGGAYQGLVSGKGLFFDVTPFRCSQQNVPPQEKGTACKTAAILHKQQTRYA